MMATASSVPVSQSRMTRVVTAQLVGGRRISKLRSLRTMLPTRPASELTPRPNSRLPVGVSFTRTSMSLNSLPVSFSSTVIWGGPPFSGSFSKMFNRVSSRLAISSSGYISTWPG